MQYTHEIVAFLRLGRVATLRQGMYTVPIVKSKNGRREAILPHMAGGSALTDADLKKNSPNWEQSLTVRNACPCTSTTTEMPEQNRAPIMRHTGLLSVSAISGVMGIGIAGLEFAHILSPLMTLVLPAWLGGGVSGVWIYMGIAAVSTVLAIYTFKPLWKKIGHALWSCDFSDPQLRQECMMLLAFLPALGVSYTLLFGGGYAACGLSPPFASLLLMTFFILIGRYIRTRSKNKAMLGKYYDMACAFLHMPASVIKMGERVSYLEVTLSGFASSSMNVKQREGALCIYQPKAYPGLKNKRLMKWLHVFNITLIGALLFSFLFWGVYLKSYAMALYFMVFVANSSRMVSVCSFMSTMENKILMRVQHELSMIMDRLSCSMPVYWFMLCEKVHTNEAQLLSSLHALLLPENRRIVSAVKVFMGALLSSPSQQMRAGGEWHLSLVLAKQFPSLVLGARKNNKKLLKTASMIQSVTQDVRRLRLLFSGASRLLARFQTRVMAFSYFFYVISLVCLTGLGYYAVNVCFPGWVAMVSFLSNSGCLVLIGQVSLLLGIGYFVYLLNAVVRKSFLDESMFAQVTQCHSLSIDTALKAMSAQNMAGLPTLFCVNRVASPREAHAQLLLPHNISEDRPETLQVGSNGVVN